MMTWLVAATSMIRVILGTYVYNVLLTERIFPLKRLMGFHIRIRKNDCDF